MATELHDDGAQTVRAHRRARAGSHNPHDVLVAEPRHVELSPEAAPGRQAVLGAPVHLLDGHEHPVVGRLVHGAEAPSAQPLQEAHVLPVDGAPGQPARQPGGPGRSGAQEGLPGPPWELRGAAAGPGVHGGRKLAPEVTAPREGRGHGLFQVDRERLG